MSFYILYLPLTELGRTCARCAHQFLKFGAPGWAPVVGKISYVRHIILDLLLYKNIDIFYDINFQFLKCFDILCFSSAFLTAISAIKQYSRVYFHYGSFLKRLFAYLRVDVRFTGVQMSFELYSKPQRAQLRTYMSARKTAKTCAQPCPAPGGSNLRASQLSPSPLSLPLSPKQRERTID